MPMCGRGLFQTGTGMGVAKGRGVLRAPGGRLLFPVPRDVIAEIIRVLHSGDSQL